LDLSSFWELLCDPSVEKIVHAGDQDVEPVVRHIGKEPANLFDTQIAAGMAQIAYPIALSKLVMEITGARLGKGLTFTHWDQRPLSPMQLRYAADDVRYLPAVRDAIGKRLEKLGHVEWVRQECAEMCNASQYVFNPQTAYQRVRGSAGLPPQGLAVLRELTIWRDQAARQEDVPPRAMLKDEILLDMARNPAKSIEKLDRVRGLPRPIESEHGQALVDATLRALALPRTEMPEQKNYEPSPTERFGAESLWAAAQTICAAQGIDPALVTTHSEIADLYRRLRHDESIDDLHVTKTWRADALGKPLLQLVRENKSFEFTWTDGCLVNKAGLSS
jgi:ribonuclease D